MKTPLKQTPSNTVYISNLSYDRDRNGLRSMFSKFGEIKNIKIVVEPSTNQSRGMAFIEMATIEQATAAIKGLDQQNFDGRTVKAKFATPLKPSSVGRARTIEEKKVQEKDLSYKSIQLAKKARNDAKRKNTSFIFTSAKAKPTK